MQLEGLIWILLPVLVAAGSALLSYAIMHARLQVIEARERASLAEAEAALKSCQKSMEERVRAVEEETRRKALTEFLQEIRVEERHYFRENRGPALRRKVMVMQERLYFRNIPLSNWVEHELTVEENVGETAQALATAASSSAGTFPKLDIGEIGSASLLPLSMPA